MSRVALDALTATVVVLVGLSAVSFLVLEIGRHELGLRSVALHRTLGLALTGAFLLLVALRFSLL